MSVSVNGGVMATFTFRRAIYYGIRTSAHSFLKMPARTLTLQRYIIVSLDVVYNVF